MSDLLFVILGLWALSGFVLLFFRPGTGSSSTLLHIVLGSLLALSIWGMPPLSSGTLQLPWPRVSFELSFSTRLLVPVIYLTVLIHLMFGGQSRVAPLLASQSIVLLFVGVILPILVGLGQLGRAILGFGQSLVITQGGLRVQIAESASLLAGLFLLVLLYQQFRFDFRNRWRCLAACTSLAAAGAVQGTLAATGSYWGAANWLATVRAELIGWGVASLALSPVIVIFLLLVDDSQVAGGSEYNWSFFRLVRESLSYEKALRKSENRVVKLNDHLRLLTDLRREIVHASDERKLLDRFARRLVEADPFAACWIELSEQASGNSGQRVWASAGWRQGSIAEEHLKRHEPGAVEVHDSSTVKQGLLIEEVVNHPLHREVVTHHTFGWAAFPLRLEDRTIGLLVVYAESQPMSIREEQLLAGISEDLSYGLRRLQLQAQRTQRMFELNVVREVMTELISEHDQSRLLNIVIERAVNLLSADGGEIFLKEGRQPGLSLAAKYGICLDRASAKGDIDSQFEAADGSEAAFDPGQEVFPPDINDCESLSAPLRWGDQHNGAIKVYRRRQHPFTDQDLKLLELFANQAALALENAHSIEAERQRSSELEVLRQASLSMTSSLELPAVLEAILEQALFIVDADDAHIFTYDGETLHFGAALWAGGKKGEPHSNPRSDGLTYTVAHSGERIVVAKTLNHPLFQSSGWNWDGAIVGIPLKVGGRVLGVMNVAFDRPHQFTDQELHVLGLLADQAALVVENSRLFEKTAAEQQRLRLLFDVASELAASMDPDFLLQRAIEVTTENLDGLTGCFFRADLDSVEMELIALAGMPPEMMSYLNENKAFKVGEGIIGWVAERGEPTFSEDVTHDDRWVKIPGIDDQVRSALATPVSLEDEGQLGVMAVFHIQQGVFNAEHLELMVALGQQISLAWSNAHRYRQVERRLAERTAIQQVAQVINSRLDMEELLKVVVDQVSGVLGYPVVDISLVEGNELVMRARSAPSGLLEFRTAFDQGIVGKVARTGKPILVDDVQVDPDYFALEPETRCEIAVPLHKGEVVIGILNVESPVAGSLGEDDLRLLTLLGDQISIAIENAALYERLRSQTEYLEEAVEQRTAQLSQALERAREADRLKTQFVSDVSHELRTPLSNIRLYVELLDQAEEDNFSQYLATLGRETERLVILIEDLLSISRLDAESTPVNLITLNLNALSKALVDDRKRLFSDRNLELRWQPEEPDAWVYADEKLLSQVIANLMTNAMHYTPAGGRVELRTRVDESDDWVCLEVSDTGLGIPEAEMDLLFSRFFRGSASRTMAIPGTGLGLAICREIIDRHQGRITVDSRVGEGSRFTVWLPPATVGEESEPSTTASSNQSIPSTS